MKDIIGWLLRLNITDDFKKFFKWLVIIIIVLFLLLVIWFAGSIVKNKYDTSEETMIALECHWIESNREVNKINKIFGIEEEIKKEITPFSEVLRKVRAGLEEGGFPQDAFNNFISEKGWDSDSFIKAVDKESSIETEVKEKLFKQLSLELLKLENIAASILKSRSKGNFISETNIAEGLKYFNHTIESFEEEIKSRSDKSDNTRRWYLVKKERSQDQPSAIYIGSHNKAVVGEEQVFVDKYHKKSTDNYYHFGESSYNRTINFSINRKTLTSTQIYEEKTKAYAFCYEISESEFYRNVEREIKIKKDSVKF